MGPLPKPTALRALQGDLGKGRVSIPIKEPQPTSDLPPVADEWLSPEARAEWEKVYPAFRAMGLLKDVDSAKFHLYCHALAEIKRLAKQIKEEGYKIETPNTRGTMTVQKNPLLEAYNACFTQLIQLGDRFGDSPAGRCKLGRLEDSKSNQLDQFLNELDQKQGGQ